MSKIFTLYYLFLFQVQVKDNAGNLVFFFLSLSLTYLTSRQATVRVRLFNVTLPLHPTRQSISSPPAWYSSPSSSSSSTSSSSSSCTPSCSPSPLPGYFETLKVNSILTFTHSLSHSPSLFFRLIVHASTALIAV